MPRTAARIATPIPCRSAPKVFRTTFTLRTPHPPAADSVRSPLTSEHRGATAGLPTLTSVSAAPDAGCSTRGQGEQDVDVREVPQSDRGDGHLLLRVRGPGAGGQGAGPD